MSFEGELKKKTEEIRHWAVKRMFEDEGYLAEKIVEKDGKLEDEGGFFTGRKELTKKRYESGPSPHPSPHGDPGDMDENITYVARQGTEVWKMKYDQLDWVYDLVKDFGQGNPSKLESLASSVGGVPFQLMADSSWASEDKKGLNVTVQIKGKSSDILLKDAVREAEHWTGDTADIFATTYGSDSHEWEKVVHANYDMSDTLVKAVEAQLAVIIAARRDVINICNQAITVLSGMESKDAEGEYLGFTVLGALTTAALSVAGLGLISTVVGAAFAIGSGTISAAESGKNFKNTGKPGGKFEVDGDTASAVLSSMSWAISELTKSICDEEDKIANALIKLYNHALSHRSRYVIGTKEPKLNNPTDGWGNRVSGKLDYLAKAAEKSFPPAAQRLHSANSDLAAVSGESVAFHSETYGFETVVCAPWIALRQLIQDYVGTNANKVENTGKVMLQFAKDAGAVDDDAAKEIDKTYKDFDSTGSGKDHEKLDKV